MRVLVSASRERYLGRRGGAAPPYLAGRRGGEQREEHHEEHRERGRALRREFLDAPGREVEDAGVVGVGDPRGALRGGLVVVHRRGPREELPRGRLPVVDQTADEGRGEGGQREERGQREQRPHEDARAARGG
ncbi:hypothetical protein AB0N09_06615 [Streptomyces erythrochromogenes]|uniref:hypothetical protein n=1 Tax=Streptomyces erythrochromogenes TaxID=285574 RepID=UPI00342CDAFD